MSNKLLKKPANIDSLLITLTLEINVTAYCMWNSDQSMSQTFHDDLRNLCQLVKKRASYATYKLGLAKLAIFKQIYNKQNRI